MTAPKTPVSGNANMDYPAPNRPCPNCETQATTPLPEYSCDGWVICRCDACEMVYLKNPPDYAELVEDFAWEKTYEKEAAYRENRASMPRRLNRRLRKWFDANYGERHTKRLERLLGGGAVLDIGCGAGDRLGPPFVPYGIELSKALHAQADAYMKPLGGECLHAPGAEGVWTFPKNNFDSVVMHSYLEHEADVLKTLRGAAHCLKPGGKIFVRVPNFALLNRRIAGASWCGFRYPDHVNYFTLASLRSVAQKTGFEVRLVNKISLWFNDNIHALLIKKDTQLGT